MIRLSAILYLVAAPFLCGQTFSVGTLRSAGTMQCFVGTAPSVLALQLSTAGDVQVPTRLAVGAGVSGAERMRIGQLQAMEGNGLVVDMAGTLTSNGLAVVNVGATGSDHAGIVIQSASNGSGTGLRLGGPSGSVRPTLGTGIDITGGTGVRYNALTAGTATALDIGGTVPPARGVDVTTSGTDNVAGFFRSNMLGTAVIGSTQSSAYADPVHRPRVGVRGHAATNSAASADDIIGVYGTAVRGGNGGSQTLSVAVCGRAESASLTNSGLVEALRGEVVSTGAGSYGMIGTHLIVPGQSNAFALVNSGGASVYLGGSDDDRPPGLSTTVQAALGLGNMSTTYMHDARLTGMMSAKGFAMRGFTIPDLVRGATDNVDIGSASVIRVWSTAPGSTITGFTGGVDGRVLVVVNRGSDLTLAHENGGSLDRNRITTSTGDDITTIGAGTATLWYDASYGRWIVVSFIP